MVPDFRNSQGLWATTGTEGGKKQHTVSNGLWYAMKARCRGGNVYPSYEGVTMAGQFLTFQGFADWYTSQKGYGRKGYAVDKDILLKGNKVYSEKHCVLVPVQLNSFLRPSARGVTFNKSSNKYRAQLSIGNIQTHVGEFLTYKDAREAYIKAKEDECRRWVARLKDGEFEVDVRVIEALEDWTVDG